MRVIRRLASATNLVIAGKVFAVHGAGERSTALATTLTLLGARPAGPDAAIDYLFLTGEGAETAELPTSWFGSIDSGPRRPLLIVDASLLGIPLEHAGFGPLEPVRPGVLQTGIPDVFFVPHPDPAAPSAHEAATRIRWAERFMPVSNWFTRGLRQDGILAGVRIGVSMVLEPKTAVLALLLRSAGAEVSVFAHPDETDDSVADALRAEGIAVDARSTATGAEHLALALAFLDREPQILLDDGSHLIRLAHTDRPALLASMIGAAEETTSGLRALDAMQQTGLLGLPVVAVNDARSKTLFDNLYGTGESCVFAVLDLLDASIEGAAVVVAGFGPVGEGVARTVAALGGSVVVAERDPVRALQAVFAGYRVAPLAEAVATADYVLSATGVQNTISVGVLEKCAPDAVIAVAGGVPQEVAVRAALKKGAVREELSAKVQRLRLPNGGSVLLLDDGGCINVTAGEGNPIDIMDLSFAVQLGAVRFLLESGDQLAPGLYPIDKAVDDRISARAVRGSGSRIDRGAGAARSASTAQSPRFDRKDGR